MALCVALATTASVLYLQYEMGVAPCHLCLDERLPWYALIAVLAAGAYASRRGRAPRCVPFLFMASAGLFASSLVLGTYHLGMERAWWYGDIACAAGADQGRQFAGLMDRFMNATAVPCDKPSMLILNLSLAGWNAALSGAMFVYAVVALVRFNEDRKAEARLAMAELTER